jgi:hypothetical protein
MLYIANLREQKRTQSLFKTEVKTVTQTVSADSISDAESKINTYYSSLNTSDVTYTIDIINVTHTLPNESINIIQGSTQVTGSLSISSGSLTVTTASFSLIEGGSPIRLMDSVSFESDITSSGTLSSSANIIAQSFTGSFSGSITEAISSSYASTASYVENAQTASFITTAQTASYVLASNIDQPFTNITASGNISASGNIIGGNITSNGLNVISQSGAFTGNEFIVAVGANAVTSSDALAVDNGNLGIGTSSPTVRLHMVGEGAQTAQFLMEQYNDTADAPDIRTRRYRGTEAAPADVQTGDYLFRFNVHGQDDGNSELYGSMRFDVDGTNQDAMVWGLQTRDTAGNVADRITIDSSGNVSMTGSLLGTVTTASYIEKNNIDGLLLSSSAQIASDISGAFGESSASFSTRITTNETDISTLNSAGLLSSSAQIASDISGAFGEVSASFSTRVTTNETDIITLTSKTGSYAITGSNNFIGDQDITGNIIASGNISASGYISASSFNATPGTTNELTASYAITASHTMNIQPENNFMPVVTHTSNFNSEISYAGRYNIVGGNLSITVTTGSTPTDLTPGMEWNFFQTSSGNNFTFTAGTGVNLVSRNAHTKLAAIGSAGTLKYISDQTFHLIGDLTL